MDENGYGGNAQYDNGQYGDGSEQQYSNGQYGYGNEQQYSGGQYGDGSGQQYSSLREQIPDGLMERLPGWIRDKAEDAIAMADQENLNRERYGHVEPYTYTGHGFRLLTAVAVLIGFGGAFFFVFIKPHHMIALICFGIMMILSGIGDAANKNYSFRKAPMYTMLPVLGVIFILVALYHLFAKYFPSLPQPVSRGWEVWVCGLFSVLGAVMLVLDSISFCCMRKVCTEPVSAVCVYLKRKVERSSNNKNSTTKYSGVFEYQFRGNTYLAAEPYGDKDVPNVAGRYDLYINPSDPTDFYRKSWKIIVWSLIGEISFIVFPIILCPML